MSTNARLTLLKVGMSVDTQPIPQMLCNCELSAAFQFTVGGISADCQYCVPFCFVLCFAEMSPASILIRHCGATCNTTILACRVKKFKQKLTSALAVLGRLVNATESPLKIAA